MTLSDAEREAIARALHDLSLVTDHTGPILCSAIERQYSDLNYAALRELVTQARSRGYVRGLLRTPSGWNGSL